MRMGGLGFGAVLMVALIGSTAASAATYTFSGVNGNVGGSYSANPDDTSPPAYSFGVLPTGDSTFAVTNNDFIPFPSGSSHSFANAFTFNLATNSVFSITVNSGSRVDIVLAQVGFSPSDPHYSPCCLIAQIFGGSPDPTSPLVLTASLMAGAYNFAVVGDYPSAPPNTPSYLTETYGGSIGVTSVSPVPLPASGIMMLAALLGIGGVGAAAEKSRRKQIARLTSS